MNDPNVRKFVDELHAVKYAGRFSEMSPKERIAAMDAMLLCQGIMLALDIGDAADALADEFDRFMNIHDELLKSGK